MLASRLSDEKLSRVGIATVMTLLELYSSSQSKEDFEKIVKLTTRLNQDQFVEIWDSNLSNAPNSWHACNVLFAISEAVPYDKRELYADRLIESLHASRMGMTAKPFYALALLINDENGM